MIAGLRQDWGKQRPHSWRVHTKYCVHRNPREGAVTVQETEPDLPASVGRSSVGWGGGWLCFIMGTRTLAAEVLGSTPWCEPSQSLSLAPPKSPGRLQGCVASGKTTNREGTQPHPSTVKWIKVLLSSDHHSNSQLYPPSEPPIKPLR